MVTELRCVGKCGSVVSNVNSKRPNAVVHGTTAAVACNVVSTTPHIFVTHASASSTRAACRGIVGYKYNFYQNSDRPNQLIEVRRCDLTADFTIKRQTTQTHGRSLVHLSHFSHFSHCSRNWRLISLPNRLRIECDTLQQTCVQHTKTVAGVEMRSTTRVGSSSSSAKCLLKPACKARCMLFRTPFLIHAHSSSGAVTAAAKMTVV